MKLQDIARFTLIALLTTGCAPEPEAVCAHANEVAKKEGKKSIANCVFKLEEQRDTSAQYKQLASCIVNAKNSADVNNCIQKHQV